MRHRGRTLLLLCWPGAVCSLSLPSGPEAVVKQAADAVWRAYSSSGLNHQVVNLPLSEAIYGEREEGFVADRAIGWQGGPQETYRFLQPLAMDLLKRIDPQTGGLPPRVSEQMLLEFDGSSLLTSESAGGPLDDVQAILQANTDKYYLDIIARVEDEFSDVEDKPKRLLLLVNPAWRDRSSWGFFDGAAAQRLIFDRYEETYALSQFVIRGEKLTILKAYGHPWHVFLTVLGGGVDPRGIDAVGHRSTAAARHGSLAPLSRDRIIGHSTRWFESRRKRHQNPGRACKFTM